MDANIISDKNYPTFDVDKIPQIFGVFSNLSLDLDNLVAIFYVDNDKYEAGLQNESSCCERFGVMFECNTGEKTFENIDTTNIKSFKLICESSSILKFDIGNNNNALITFYNHHNGYYPHWFWLMKNEHVIFKTSF